MKKKILLSVLASAVTTSVYAYDMKPVGFKAMSMGGTGVASTRGSLAGYYNPALLRFSDHTTELSLNVGVRLRETNLVDHVDALEEMDFTEALDTLADNAEQSEISVSIDESLKSTLDTLVASGDVNITAAMKAEIDSYNFSDLSTTDISTLEGYTGSDADFEVEGNTLVYTQESTLGIYDKKATEEAAQTIEDAIDIITKKIGTKNALQVSATPTFAAQISDAMAIGIYGDLDLGLRVNVDENYDQLITKQEQSDGSSLYYSYDTDTNSYSVTTDSSEYEKSSIEYATEEEVNYIAVDSVILGEVPISYAKAYDWNSGTWSFGLNLKPMTLTTYSTKVALGNSVDDASDDIEDYETTYKPTIGLDLGLAYRPVNSKMTFGFIAKNINSPTFKVDESATGITEDYKIDPLVRAGMSIPFWNDNVEFAFDADLTKNDTLIEDEQSQFVGAGLEFHPASWFAISVGAMQDIAAEKFDDGTIMTGGLGFGTKWLQIDLSAMVSTKSGNYDGNEIPRYTAVNLALVSKWGDGYNRKRAPQK